MKRIKLARGPEGSSSSLMIVRVHSLRCNLFPFPAAIRLFQRPNSDHAHFQFSEGVFPPTVVSSERENRDRVRVISPKLPIKSPKISPKSRFETGFYTRRFGRTKVLDFRM